MKKSLVFAAVALVAGAAHADVSLYGLLDVSYGKSVYSDAIGDKATFHFGGDNGSSEGNSTSRFGLKGSTDVGSGIKANFKLESGGIQSDGSLNAYLFNRQAWAGFSGSFGEVRLGRQDSVAFQTMIDYDFNGASNGVSALGYTAVAPWLPGRQSRSLQYIAPKMGPVALQLGYQAKAGSASTALVGDVTEKNVFSAGATVDLGAFAASVAYQSKATSAGDDFASLSARYDFGVAKVMVGYADGGTNAKGVSAGVVAPVAGFTVGALVSRNSDTKVKGLELFANKEVLKNTYAYVEAGKIDAPSGGTDATGYAVGVIYTF